MRASTIGLLAGLLLAIAAAAGGFEGFLIALVLGTAGFLLGGLINKEIDFAALVGRRGRG